MLALEHVSYAPSDGGCSQPILRDTSLTLRDRALYAITGPNGGGKSTLARLIMGIYRATTGRISLDGLDISDLSIDERARLGIGYAFQQPPRFKGLTVRRLLALAAGERSNEVDVQSLLLRVGLCPKDYVDREIDATLSGGELKRIELASILARNLRVAVFDEPEAGIDLWSFRRLAQTFEEIHDQTDSTIVIISHQERILELADEIILVVDGQVEASRSRDEVLSAIRDEEACRCSLATGEGVEEHVGYFRQH
jgi:Fe-S cluster assembly ATP-binding protein